MASTPSSKILNSPSLFSLLLLLAWGAVSLLLPSIYQAFTFIFLLYWVWKDGNSSLKFALPIMVAFVVAEHFLPTPHLSFDSLFVTIVPGLIALLMVAYMRERDRQNRNNLENSLRLMQTLEEGSLGISSASDALELTENAMNALLQLGIAPHIAFIRFREGKPVIVSARGALERYRGRILPQQRLSAHASLSDTFQVGSYLEGIPESTGWSTAAVPVSARQKRPLGVVLLGREGQKAFSANEKALANSLSRVMGAQLGQMEAVKQLEDAYDGTLRALGLALEFRDHETQGHTKRVVQLADQMAADLNLDPVMRKFLRWGAYLHDIGKLSIPDSILLKPGKLDDKEWEIMQSHVTKGWEMLSRVPFLPQETLEVVRHHHESWDGTGYPDGLSGENIPLMARIFAIVDIFDALHSARPYKRAWKPAEILAELKRLKGKKLDPQLVDIFIRRITTAPTNPTQETVPARVSRP